MKILFIGHSMIEFFDWQKRFPAHSVSNLGVAGETVEGLLSRINGIIEKYAAADLIFIMTGLNNVAMEDFEFFDFFRIIIKNLSAAYPEAKIYINSLLPVDVEFISNASIKDVNRMLRDIAGKEGAEFLDMYSLFVDTNGRARKEYLLDDGVHLGKKGYDIWSDALENIINE